MLCIKYIFNCNGIILYISSPPLSCLLKIELSLNLVNIRFHLFRVFGIIIEGDIRLRRKHWNQFYYYLKCYWHFSINKKCFWHLSINKKCFFLSKINFSPRHDRIEFFLLRKLNLVFFYWTVRGCFLAAHSCIHLYSYQEEGRQESRWIGLFNLLLFCLFIKKVICLSLIWSG